MMNQKGLELASVEEHNQQQHEINIPVSSHINTRKLTTKGTDQLHSTDQTRGDLVCNKMMRQAGVQLTSTNEQNPLISQQQQQQEIMNTPIDLDDVNARRLPNLPQPDLLTGPRDEYVKFCLPLYEASVKCDWKAAKAILDQKPDLVRNSITENGGTALHVAASAEICLFHVLFVENVVDLMEKEDLELENENFNTALYLAAAAGNFGAVRIMVEKNRDLLTIPGAGRQMLPLNVAALFRNNYCTVEYLYENSNDLRDVDGWTDARRGLLLEKCLENNYFDVALLIVKKYPELGRRGSVLGVLAQNPDAFLPYSKPNIIRRIIIKMVRVEAWWEACRPALHFLRLILDDIVRLPKNEIDSILIIRGPNAIKQANKPVSDQALELEKLISEHIVNMHVQTQNILGQDSKSTNFIKGDQAVQLEKVISEHITKMQVKTQNIIRGPAAKDTLSSEALFTAAEMGNTTFVVEVIRRFPDIMWKVNDSNQTIFHIAVENRHEGIYSLLYEIGYMKDWITSLEDENGNNMLHLVAKIANKRKLEDFRVMFQLQREFLWFEKVEFMINPSCRKRKNKDGLKPYELFTKEHEDLLAKSVKWVKGTANQSMVVAALVATIAFAAAITVPGGYKQDNGIPIFYRDTAYTIFILADALSLFASSVSMLMFITILTSPFAEHEFCESIPRKFTILLSTLILSITAMIVSFSVSFFIIYHKERRWIPIFISVITACPVFMYLFRQYHLFLYIFRSTLEGSPKKSFRPKKPVLYYQNPVV